MWYIQRIETGNSPFVIVCLLIFAVNYSYNWNK